MNEDIHIVNLLTRQVLAITGTIILGIGMMSPFLAIFGIAEIYSVLFSVVYGIIVGLLFIGASRSIPEESKENKS